MITELFISNLAIIENTNIKFTNGLNIITGETGSGKSIIIEAVELLLGSRANKNLVGNYGEKAIVEGVVKINDRVKNMLCEEYGISADDELIITRELFKDGKSIVRLDNRQVKLKVIKSIMDLTVNIHSQHDTQLLLNPYSYLEIIDFISEAEIDDLKSDLEDLLDEKKRIIKRIEKLEIDSSEIERQIDILQYQINEINSLRLEEIDIDKLEKEHNLLNNSIEISSKMNSTKELFISSDYNSGDLSSYISKATGLIESISEYDERLSKICDNLKNTGYIIEDLKYEILDYYDSIVTDDERLYELDSLFHNIDSLKRKYGKDIDDILKYKDKAEIELNEYRLRDELLESLNVDIAKLNRKLDEKANKISDIRKKTAREIQNQIQSELSNLNFANNEFIIEFSKKSKVDKDGIDIIRFLASFNLGQQIKPLSEIASGGELSRFMLALKIVIADYDNISTLIFDEIDSGISGITAQVVGEVIDKLSENYQIILVTHLPQIAVLGDNHMIIKKYTENSLTKTKLQAVEGEELVYEIARLLSGTNITDTVLENAREQLTRRSRTDKENLCITKKRR
ncbi:MAG: DNA repair protein RecN [Tissierellia bacterium]|nr:DNA repair protein RecN [Tissierellia bacterium]